MADRMIDCPECGGDGYLPEDYVCDSPCLTCKGSGTIPDRRRPTANDRAVERIEERARKPVGDGDYELGAADELSRIILIIREEADRG